MRRREEGKDYDNRGYPATASGITTRRRAKGGVTDQCVGKKGHVRNSYLFDLLHRSAATRAGNSSTAREKFSRYERHFLWQPAADGRCRFRHDAIQSSVRSICGIGLLKHEEARLRFTFCVMHANNVAGAALRRMHSYALRTRLHARSVGSKVAISVRGNTRNFGNTRVARGNIQID